MTDAQVEAAKVAFDWIWMGGAYQGMFDDAIRAALAAAQAGAPRGDPVMQHILKQMLEDAAAEIDRLKANPDDIQWAGTGCATI